MISQRLRELRLKKNLTLQQVATELGVTRASVSKWETSASRPELRRIEDLASIFNVPVSYLLGDVDSTSIGSYPVVEIASGEKFSSKVLHKIGLDSFPSICIASQKSFYIRVKDDELVHSKFASIQPGALVLIDPSLKPSSGDVVFVNNANGFAHFAILTIVGGITYFEAINPKYSFDRNQKTSLIGVAIEAIHITDLTVFGQKIIKSR